MAAAETKRSRRKPTPSRSRPVGAARYRLQLHGWLGQSVLPAGLFEQDSQQRRWCERFLLLRRDGHSGRRLPLRIHHHRARAGQRVGDHQERLTIRRLLVLARGPQARVCMQNGYRSAQKRDVEHACSFRLSARCRRTASGEGVKIPSRCHRSSRRRVAAPAWSNIFASCSLCFWVGRLRATRCWYVQSSVSACHVASTLLWWQAISVTGTGDALLTRQQLSQT